MLFVWFSRLLLCLGSLFAARKGGEPERLVAFILVAMFLGDVVNHMLFGTPTWFDVNPGHMVIDLCALVALTWVALKANRAWPLWISAMQLIVVVGHITKLIALPAARRGYWAMTEVPFPMELVALIIGTWAHIARQRRIGGYGPWRPT